MEPGDAAQSRSPEHASVQVFDDQLQSCETHSAPDWHAAPNDPPDACFSVDFA